MDAPATLVTARLRGLRITESDRGFYQEIWQDPAVVRTLGGPRSPAQIDAKVDRLLAAWEARGSGVYTLHDAQGPCGYAGLMPTQAAGRASVEVLYGLLPRAWGQGLATEAARALVRLGLDTLALPEVCGFTWTENAGSRRVLEKSGLHYAFDFVLEGLPHRYYCAPPLSR